VLEEIGFEIPEFEKDGAMHISGVDPRITHEDEYLRALAPFVPDGCYIVWITEDGQIWRDLVKGGKIVQQDAKIVFENSEEAVMYLPADETEWAVVLEDMAKRLRSGESYLAQCTKSGYGDNTISVTGRCTRYAVTAEELTEVDKLKEDISTLRKIIREAKQTLDRDPTRMW